jgi:hypothetical protein
MKQVKAADPKIRKNIMMPASVIEMGKGLKRSLHKSSFSQLLTDLVRDAHQREAQGGDKSPKQYLVQIVDLLEKNQALEATLKERMERFRLERKGATEALALCEEDLRKAREQA